MWSKYFRGGPNIWTGGGGHIFQGSKYFVTGSSWVSGLLLLLRYKLLLLLVTPVMDSLLVNPVLAYVKAFRLRGDSDSLKHAALGKFAPACSSS